MRAVLYCRVSTDPHHQGRSVGEQESECRQFCEARGWDVVRVFVDTDRSASRYAKLTRPAYQQLVKFIEGDGADCLVTWEASRSTRDLEAYVALRGLCRSTRTLWCYNGRLFDLNRGDDSFQTGLDILLAEREVDQTRDRIMRAVKANAVKGRPHGKILFGYEREYDSRTGALVRQVIREDQAALIREAANRILSGESAYAVSCDWNQREVPAPKNGKWDTSRMKRILTNPAYIAKRVHQGQIIGDATWPPILDEATYYQLYGLFNDPERKKYYEPTVKFLLSAIAKCGVCGGKILVRRPRGYSTYVCVDNFCVARKVSWVEDLITELIIARLNQPDAVEVFARRTDSGVAEAVEQMRAIRERLDGFYEAAAEGRISPAALGKIEERLLVEIGALENKVKRSDIPTAIYELVDNPAEKWEALTISQRRAVVKTLLDIQILPARPGVRVFDPSTVSVAWKQISPEDGQSAPETAGEPSQAAS